MSAPLPFTHGRSDSRLQPRPARSRDAEKILMAGGLSGLLGGRGRVHRTRFGVLEYLAKGAGASSAVAVAAGLDTWLGRVLDDTVNDLAAASRAYGLVLPADLAHLADLPNRRSVAVSLLRDFLAGIAGSPADLVVDGALAAVAIELANAADHLVRGITVVGEVDRELPAAWKPVRFVPSLLSAASSRA